MNSHFSKLIAVLITAAALSPFARAASESDSFIALPSFVAPLFFDQERGGYEDRTIELKAGNPGELYGFEDKDFCVKHDLQTCRGLATVEYDDKGTLKFGQTGDTAVQLVDLGQDKIDADYERIKAISGKVLIPGYRGSDKKSIFSDLVIIRNRVDENNEMRTCGYEGEESLKGATVNVGHVYLLRAYSYGYWIQSWGGARPNDISYDNDTVVKFKIVSADSSSIKLEFQVLAMLSPYQKPVDVEDLFHHDTPRDNYVVSEAELFRDRHLITVSKPGVLNCKGRIIGERPTLNSLRYFYLKSIGD
jgi:hypothetical protein